MMNYAEPSTKETGCCHSSAFHTSFAVANSQSTIQPTSQQPPPLFKPLDFMREKVT